RLAEADDAEDADEGEDDEDDQQRNGRGALVAAHDRGEEDGGDAGADSGDLVAQRGSGVAVLSVEELGVQTRQWAVDHRVDDALADDHADCDEQTGLRVDEGEEDEAPDGDEDGPADDHGPPADGVGESGPAEDAEDREEGG